MMQSEEQPGDEATRSLRPDGGFQAEPYGEEEDGDAEEGGDIQAFVPDDEVVDAVGVEVLLTDEEEELLARNKQRRVLAIVVCAFLLLAVIIIPVSINAANNNDSGTRGPTEQPTLAPSSSPSSAPTNDGIPQIVSCLTQAGITSLETFSRRGSGQWKALQWIANEDPYVVTQGLSCPDKRYLSRYALASVFFEMSGENWISCGLQDPVCSINRNQFGWLSNNDVCDWHQVRCDGTNVIGLNFGSQFPTERILTQFSGTFPSEISYLTDLVQINLKEGGPRGPIPDFFKSLTKLQEFNLENNLMTGPLPTFFSGDTFPDLRIILFTNNQFNGTIPAIHGTLNSLREYRVASNQLKGAIPPALMNMELIAYIDLADNLLTGTVPATIFDKTELRILSLHNNAVEGTLPDNIGNLQLLERLRIHKTRFRGVIPPSLYTIPRLQEIRIRECLFEGGIDPSVENTEFLQIYDVGGNPISGPIPDVFGKIEFLEELRLDRTDLTGEITQEVCDALGTDFGQIEFLVVDCNIQRPDAACGVCVN